MGSSFKIQKSKGTKNEAKTAGVLVALLGIVVTILFDATIGGIMIIIGLVFFAASFAASE